MKLKFKSRFKPLAVAVGMALGALPLGAATVTPWAASDVFLGFRASDGQGQNTAYLVNLGQYSQLTAVSPGSSITLGGNLVDDLTSIYGSDWNTRVDLNWGVFGTNNGTNPHIYASREDGLAAWDILPLGDRNAAKSSITTVFTGLGVGWNYLEESANNPNAASQVNASGAGSYIYQVSGTALDFATFTGIETSVGGGKDLQLYRLANNLVANPGYFSLASDGTLTFTAVPEPSVSLLAAAGLVTLTTRRRRKVIL